MIEISLHCLAALRLVSCKVCSALAILLSTIAVLASSAWAQEVNPLAGDARAAYAGGALFRAQCATCHGADATGIASIEAPDLTRMWRERGYSDAQVFRIINEGIAGTIMPAHDFTATETWMLVNFLRSVGQTGVQDLPAGDADRGSRLFARHCAECHRLGSTGGVLGPNLGAVLAENSLPEIISAIRQPDSLIAAGYRTVRVDTGGGEPLMGVLKNEDAFSFQIIDRTQQLRAFRRSEATMSSLSRSLMPAFSEQQLSNEDLLAILNFIQQSGD